MGIPMVSKFCVFHDLRLYGICHGKFFIHSLASWHAVCMGVVTGCIYTGMCIRCCSGLNVPFTVGYQEQGKQKRLTEAEAEAEAKAETEVKKLGKP